MSEQGSDNLPFEKRLFTSKETRQILRDGKTKFFTKTLPELDAFLDGNKLKITGESIQALIRKRLAEPRQPRPMPQPHKARTQIEPRAE